MHNNTSKRKHVRESRRSCASIVLPGWMVPHGWVPVNTHSTPVLFLGRRLWEARHTETTEHHMSHKQRAQHTPQDLRVAHSSGALGEPECCVLRETP